MANPPGREKGYRTIRVRTRAGTQPVIVSRWMPLDPGRCYRLLLRVSTSTLKEELGGAHDEELAGRRWDEQSGRLVTCHGCPVLSRSKWWYRRRERPITAHDGCEARECTIRGPGDFLIDARSQKRLSLSFHRSDGPSLAVVVRLAHASGRHLAGTPPDDGTFWGLASWAASESVMLARGANALRRLGPRSAFRTGPEWTPAELADTVRLQASRLEELGATRTAPESY